jgi:hypothetical protein
LRNLEPAPLLPEVGFELAAPRFLLPPYFILFDGKMTCLLSICSANLLLF